MHCSMVMADLCSSVFHLERRPDWMSSKISNWFMTARGVRQMAVSIGMPYLLTRAAIAN